MKDSKIEWVGEIPEGWKNYKLKNLIATHFSGNWGLEPMGDDNDLLCIRIADFDFGNQTIKLSANTFRHYTYSQANRLLLQDGDLLLEKSGGGDKTPVGRVVMFERRHFNGLTLFANFSECLRVNESNIARYIAYYLKALYYNCNMCDFFTQTTGLQNLNLFKYLNVKIAIPSIAEQQRIADFLDGGCEKIDKLKADIEAQIETLEKYKRSVITEAVTQGLNSDAPMKNSGAGWMPQVPAHWKVHKFKYHLSLRGVKNHGDKQVLSLYRDYGIVPKDSRDDNFNVTSENTSDYRYVRVGDFVVNKMKAWQGSVAVSVYEGIVSPAYYVYEFSDELIDRRYFHFLMRNRTYTTEFRRLSGGIREGQWDLPAEALENTLILIPPLLEQQAIAEYLDEKCARIDELISQKQSQIETLEAYKKSLIFEYITGKKEVVCSNV